MRKRCEKRVAPGVYVRAVEGRFFRGKPNLYFTLRYKIAGKIHHEALGWASEGWNLTKAQTELARLKVAQATGDGATTLNQRRNEQRARQELENSKPTFETVWLAYSETLSPSMLANAKTYCRKHLQEILPLKIEDLRTYHIDKVKRELEDKGLSPKSINNCLAFVRAVIFWGARRGYCKQPLLHELAFEMKHVDNIVTENLFDRDELQRFLHALNNYPDKRLAAAALFSLHTGMRRAALFSLVWGDVDFLTGQICLRGEHAKNGKTSFIPLTAEVEELLKGLPGGAADELIFGEKDPYSRRVKRLTKYLEPYLPEVAQPTEPGLRPRKFRPFHGLRHSFGSFLASNGVDLLTIGKLLTQTSPGATVRYAHLSNEGLRKRASLVGSIIEQAAGSIKGSPQPDEQTLIQ